MQSPPYPTYVTTGFMPRSVTTTENEQVKLSKSSSINADSDDDELIDDALDNTGPDINEGLGEDVSYTHIRAHETGLKIGRRCKHAK